MTRAGYDFWLFDLDGTLVDIEPWYPKAVIGRVGDELGVDFSEHEAEVLWYGMGGTRDEYLAKRSVPPELFWQTFHEVENPRARARATYLYDDAAEYVESLEGPVGLVTHCQRYLTGPVLDELDIRDWFDAVVCCSDATGWKPDPDPVERLMRKLDVDPATEDGILIGDDPADVGAAEAAGLDAVQVLRRSPTDAGEPAPDACEAADGADPTGIPTADGGEDVESNATDGGDGIVNAAADGGVPTGEHMRIRSFKELS